MNVHARLTNAPRTIFADAGLKAPVQISDHQGPGPVPGPGFYRMAAATYHADPAPEPSLSSSLIPLLALPGSSPAHAWLAHPRLGQAEADEEEDAPVDKMSVGSVAHELLLGHGGGFEICDFPTWQSKAAKEARDEAVERGKVPIKAGDYDRADGIAAALRTKLEEFEETQGLFAKFRDERSEVVVIFRCPITGIWGRAMIDRWGPKPHQLWDLKTTQAPLSEDFIQRQIDGGLGARAWWYRHAIATLVPELQGRLQYRWIFGEQRKPHEILIRSPAAEHLYVGERQALTAALRFRHHLKTRRWPGFPRLIVDAQVKPWAARDWQARETYSPDLAEISGDMARTLSPFRPELAGLADDAEIMA